MRKLEAISLRTAIAVPFIYLGNLVLSSIYYPGYSQLRQQVSELGARGAPHPDIFNYGVIIIGVAILIGAIGFFLALRRLAVMPVLTWLTSAILVLFGISTLLAAFFPLPDSRHAGGFLGLVLILGPIFLATALWKRSEARFLNGYLIFTSILTVATFLVLMGIGGLRTNANLGLLQRVFVLAALPWIGVAAYFLIQMPGISKPNNSPDPTRFTRGSS